MVFGLQNRPFIKTEMKPISNLKRDHQKLNMTYASLVRQITVNISGVISIHRQNTVHVFGISNETQWTPKHVGLTRTLHQANKIKTTSRPTVFLKS